MTDRAYGMFGPALKVWGAKLNINAASQNTLAGVVWGFVQPSYTVEQVQTPSSTSCGPTADTRSGSGASSTAATAYSSS